MGTLPEYRRRGLVRIQFDVLHAWSRQRGELVQVITGIPNYYRQFGYEYAIDLDGGRCVYPSLIPELKDGEAEAYRFRLAMPDNSMRPLVQSFNTGPLRSTHDLLWPDTAAPGSWMPTLQSC